MTDRLRLSRPGRATHAWFAGVTTDHLYADCPNRVTAKTTLQRAGLWHVGGESGIDPHGTDVCGMCVHRYNRKEQSA